MQRIFTILLLFIIMVPLAFAQNEHMSASDLRSLRMWESLDDLIFKLKSAFTFGDQNNVDLVRERNQQLITRQQEWLHIKQLAGPDTQQEFNKEHSALIENYMNNNQQLDDLKENSDAELQQKIAQVEDEMKPLAQGLNLHLNQESQVVQTVSSGDISYNSTEQQSDRDARDNQEDQNYQSYNEVRNDTMTDKQYSNHQEYGVSLSTHGASVQIQVQNADFSGRPQELLQQFIDSISGSLKVSIHANHGYVEQNVDGELSAQQQKIWALLREEIAQRSSGGTVDIEIAQRSGDQTDNGSSTQHVSVKSSSSVHCDETGCKTS